MESMGGKIVGGANDFEIEVETRKQPKGGYMYFYMTECKRMKEGGEHISSISVLGVGNEGKSVVEVYKSKNWKALTSKYGLKHKVTYAEFEEEIKSGSYLGDELKARVLLYLVEIFLCPTGDTSTNKDYMKLICDEGLKGEFNWVEYVHSRLIELIITFKKDNQRYLKGCIVILEVALFNFWPGCEAVPAYERTGVAHIRAWGKEEVVRVMAKLKLDRPRKQERSNFDILMSELADIKINQFGIMQRQSRVEEKLERVEETLERHKGELEGKIVDEKIDGVVKDIEVLRGEVVKEVEVLRGDLKMVEKADIPSGIDDIEAAICDYLWNSRLESGYFVISMGNQFASVYDVATLKPTEWVGGMVIDLLAWTVCYDSKKSLRWIDYLPYYLVQQALNANNKESVESIVNFWGPILDNYVKFTDCEKIMITINHLNSQAKRLVDGIDRFYRTTGCWRVGSIVNIKRSASTPKLAPKRHRQKHGLSQSSSQPRSSQPQPPSQTNDSSEEIRSFETLNFRSDMEKQRLQTSFKVRKFRPKRVIDLAGYDFVEKLDWKRVKEVRLDQEREEINPIGHKDDQPVGDTMMEEAPEAQVGEDVTIKTVMEYMVNFREHIDSLVSGMQADISSLRDEVSMLSDELHQRHQTNVDNQAVNDDEDEDDDDDDDPNNYIVSAAPPSRKLVIFNLNSVLAYIPRQPADVVLGTGLYEFLHFCLDNFVVSIWTSKIRHNVDRVLEKLPSFSEHFLFVWDQAKFETYDNVTYYKDLNDVWNTCPDFNELNTLLVDDSAGKMIYNPKYNCICPHTFDATSHSNNSALEKDGNIREYLENLLNAPNVPDFIRNNPFSSD
ncbi:hypothetical protein F3Y22_tig00110318pilonHSYRG00085 [Hibiscus syriacus]|uniref:FCP1 homology domain-containing protein n=1 Tax=Hibiscus syriacus TaxID=106335 RepID=A0A6A3B2N2_HIBSY|nr:hypothetical protein F3Y22_tig00110318pilonHSYRG00085 [Hibiscus syriacus]